MSSCSTTWFGRCGPTRLLETGVALGWSSLAILLALESVGHGELVSIDMPYPGMNNDAYVRYSGAGAPPLTVDAHPAPGPRRSEGDRPALRSDDLPRTTTATGVDPGGKFAYPTLWKALCSERHPRLGRHRRQFGVHEFTGPQSNATRS